MVLSAMVPPCAAISIEEFGRPWVVEIEKYSRSKKRRIRDRRTAVRRSQKQSLTLGKYLFPPDCNDVVTNWNPDAPEYVPNMFASTSKSEASMFHCDLESEYQAKGDGAITAIIDSESFLRNDSLCEVDWDSLCFNVQSEDIQADVVAMHLHPERIVSQACVSMRRQILRETLHSEKLPHITSSVETCVNRSLDQPKASKKVTQTILGPCMGRGRGHNGRGRGKGVGNIDKKPERFRELKDSFGRRRVWKKPARSFVRRGTPMTHGCSRKTQSGKLCVHIAITSV